MCLRTLGIGLALVIAQSRGWSFAELSGPYNRPNSTHRDVFPDFVSHVEQALGQEVEDYVEGVAGETRPKPREE